MEENLLCVEEKSLLSSSSSDGLSFLACFLREILFFLHEEFFQLVNTKFSLSPEWEISRIFHTQQSSGHSYHTAWNILREFLRFFTFLSFFKEVEKYFFDLKFSFWIVLHISAVDVFLLPFFFVISGSTFPIENFTATFSSEKNMSTDTLSYNSLSHNTWERIHPFFRLRSNHDSSSQPWQQHKNFHANWKPHVLQISVQCDFMSLNAK